LRLQFDYLHGFSEEFNLFDRLQTPCKCQYNFVQKVENNNVQI
jgi:hypothetical protein